MTISSLCRPLQVIKITNKVSNTYNANYSPNVTNRASYTKESFLSGTNANFLENQYLDWAHTKGSVNSSWDKFYDSLCSSGSDLNIEEVNDEFTPKRKPLKEENKKAKDKDTSLKTIQLHLAVQSLIRSYQDCTGNPEETHNQFYGEHFLGTDLRSVPHKTDCVPNDSQNEVAIAINNAKIEAAATCEPVTKIYKKHIEPLKDKGLAILTKVPSFDSTKHAMYTGRNKSYKVQKTLYKHFSDVEVPVKFTPYLIADYYENNDKTRILVFADEQKLKQIKCINKFFIDGTFKSVPSPFYQLIAIHGEIENTLESTKVRGHLLAKTDPLELTLPARMIEKMRKLQLDAKGLDCKMITHKVSAMLTEKHMDMVFQLPTRTFIGGTETSLTLREIIKRLEHVYCGSIGMEYMHLYDLDAVTFLRSRVEPPGSYDKTPEEKKLIMKRLTKAVFLEKYFATKWPAEKRFGLEGGESMIAMLEEIVDTGSRLGVKSMVIGMQHRGRLNMLVNVCRKQMVDIFAQFKPMEPKEPGSGDVKYHLGTYIHRFIRRTNKYIKVSMSANPSHLETVGPVVAGKTRAEQFWKGDNGDKVMAIIMHGDAAFCGQGVVYETCTQTNLPAFTTHGCIHIVCNNQIGYTTDPRFSRSTPYCTDVAKAIDAPIIHVNGDDGEAVAHAARVAIEYRCKFKKDVMLDLVCYRRHGHSEEDEPMFTQPFMYKKIKSMPTVDIIYANKLKGEGIANDADIKMWQKEYMDTLNTHFELAKKVTKLSIMDWIDTPWTGFFEATDPNTIKETGISQETINTIAKHFSTPPEKWAFELHKGIERMLANREKLVKEGIADWAMGEALAYGSLLKDNVHIRFTGEDVERGTMAHRHHVYHHQNVDGAQYRVLDTVYPDQARYSLHNSSLSEYGIMGFEVGYSYSSPHLLSIWEAQYGDFADTGQPIFDTFISNAESKWVCQSGIVIQLPHGIDGAGPEHSSARIERYLVQCDDDEDAIPNLDDKAMALKQLRACNWIVAHVTNSANYFHLIRRQIAMPFRKPLILFTPKVGLKHEFYRSKFSDFLQGTSFRRVIPEEGAASKKPEGVKKLIFCSGNVAIKINDALNEKKIRDQVAVCRIEQLYPFPYDLVLQEFCKYEKAKLCFCQEEHKNQGPWQFCRLRLENALSKKIEYIGRGPSPASATGIKWLHNKEIKELKEQITAL